MNHFSFPVTLLFGLLFSLAAAQNTYYDFGFERQPSIFVIENGHALAMPWVGGLNSVRFSEIDLDMDGTLDLLGFEKHGNRLLPFLRVGNDFLYAP